MSYSSVIDLPRPEIVRAMLGEAIESKPYVACVLPPGETCHIADGRKLTNAGTANLLIYSDYTTKQEEPMNCEQELAGWRPECRLCRKPVDWFGFQRDENERSITYRIHCHGSAEENSVDECEFSLNRLKGGIRQFIERRGCFREEATERDRRDSEERMRRMLKSANNDLEILWSPTEEIRDEQGNVASVIYPKYDRPELDVNYGMTSIEMERIQKAMMDKAAAIREQEILKAMTSMGTVWGNTPYTTAWGGAIYPDPPKKELTLKPKPKPAPAISVTHTRKFRLD